MRESRRVMIVRQPGREGRAVSGFGRAQLARMLAEPSAFESGAFIERTLWPYEIRTTRHARLRIDGEARECRIVEITSADVKERSQGRCRMGRARRCWEFGHALLRRGVDVERPLAMAEVEESGRLRQFVVSERRQGMQTLVEAIGRLRVCVTRETALAQTRHWAAEIARRLDVIHESGYDLPDLSLDDFVIDGQNRIGIRLCVTETAERWIRLPRRRRLQAVARFDASQLGAFLADSELRPSFERERAA
jgi:hypothetical protein